MARGTILTTFFETYLKLNRDQEESYKEALQTELKPEEVEHFMQLTTSYHEAGRQEGRIEGREEGRAEGKLEGRAEGKLEGRVEGKEEGLEMALTALQAFRQGKTIEEAMALTGLKREQLLKIKEQAN